MLALSHFKHFFRPQKTLLQPISHTGIGIHTGGLVTIRFRPEKEGFGVAFQRMDLPDRPLIPADVLHLQGTARQTILGKGQARIYLVEHVLAALAAYGIDNLCIEMTGAEPPGGDGSSNLFVQMIEEAGILEQKAERPVLYLDKPLYWSEPGVHIVAIPAEEWRVSYTLSYPDVPAIRSQYVSFAITPQTFKSEIGPCRTFSLYEEVRLLMERGLIKGGSLDNGVVIDKDVVYSKDGLRFSDEMARHKVLDIIGDLSLAGTPFIAHIIAICSGHASNVAFAKTLYDTFNPEPS